MLKSPLTSVRKGEPSLNVFFVVVSMRKNESNLNVDQGLQSVSNQFLSLNFRKKTIDEN